MQRRNFLKNLAILAATAKVLPLTATSTTSNVEQPPKNDLVFYSAGTERFRITSTGYFSSTTG